MPTPSHKFNKWADDRKKTGATPAQDNSSDDENWDKEQQVNSYFKKELIIL
jgi:pre-mRNA-splicing factor ATP-dependent RNA helicase DHX38/PRP16